MSDHTDGFPLEAERDALKDEARKLKDDWNELGVDLIDTRNRLRDSTVCLDAANARTEKYKRVIEATNANAATMVNVLITMADAGMSMPPYLPCDLKRKSGDE